MISLLPLLADTMKAVGEMVAKGSYDGTQASLSMHAAGLEHILQLSREHGIDSLYPQLIVRLLDQAVAAGHGQEELAALFEVLKRRDGGVSR